MMRRRTVISSRGAILVGLGSNQTDGDTTTSSNHLGVARRFRIDYTNPHSRGEQGEGWWNKRYGAGLTRNPKVEEKPLDARVGMATRKGPKTAHSLPVYKQGTMLQNNIRHKTANMMSEYEFGMENNLRHTSQEGTFDENSEYRDWMHGDDRRMANFKLAAIIFTWFAIYWYAAKKMSDETWEIPAPALQRPELIKQSQKRQAELDDAVAQKAFAQRAVEIQNEAVTKRIGSSVTPGPAGKTLLAGP